MMMPNVDLFTQRRRLTGGRIEHRVRFVVDGVTRPQRTFTLPDDFGTMWALLDAEEREELGEWLTLAIVRTKVENLDGGRIRGAADRG